MLCWVFNDTLKTFISWWPDYMIITWMNVKNQTKCGCRSLNATLLYPFQNQFWFVWILWNFLFFTILSNFLQIRPYSRRHLTCLEGVNFGPSVAFTVREGPYGSNGCNLGHDKALQLNNDSSSNQYCHISFV